MKIIHLSTQDYGGAGLTAYRMHKRLIRMGYSSHMYVQKSDKSDNKTTIIKKNIEYYSLLKKIIYKLKRRLSDYLLKLSNKNYTRENWISSPLRVRYGFYSLGESVSKGLNPGLVSSIDSADILFVHWVAGFVNTFDIRIIQNRTGCRVYFYSVDMAHLSGGCHFSWGCIGYQKDCSDCPALEFQSKELSIAQMSAKSINIASINAICVSGPLNAYYKSKLSSIPYSDHKVLPLVIDKNIFKATKKNRNSVSLAAKYLFSNAKPGSIRKGFSYFLQTLLILDRKLNDNQKVIVLCLDKRPFEQYKFQNIDFCIFNYCETDAALAELYHKADVFLCTSVEDYGPNMLYEALLSGIPSISFNEGVASEIISNGKNGYIVDKYDVNSLANKTFTVLFSSESTLLQPDAIHNSVAHIFDEKVWEEKLLELIGP